MSAIVADSSALMAVILEEARGPQCATALAAADRVLISAATMAEAMIVARRKGTGARLEELLAGLQVDVVPLTAADAFTAIVSSLVKDIFTPLIGLIVGGIDFSNIFFTLKGPSEATLDAAQKAGAVTMNVGMFLNAVIQFLIVAFAIFWLVRVLSRFQRKEDAPKPRMEALLEEIRDALKARAP